MRGKKKRKHCTNVSGLKIKPTGGVGEKLVEKKDDTEGGFLRLMT